MPEIIEKISAVRNTFFRTNGFLPNTIKMDMADYRELCEWAKLMQHKVINPSTGEATILNPMPEKLDKIFGMRIVKRAGEMECVFEPPVEKSNPDTCPPSKARSQLAEWFLKQGVESQRFRLEMRMPEICESGAIFDGEKTLWVMRFEQDFLMSAHTKIPIGDVKDAVTLIRIEV